MAKILNIVETAYRATLEEQDDTVLWLVHALRNAGADISVLLRGNAVNYAVAGQDASGFSVGGSKLGNPPRIDEDVRKLKEKGVKVYAVREDARERGIEPSRFIAGVESISRAELSGLVDRHDQVWHW